MGQLRHRVDTIGLAHSQYRVLPITTVSARRLEKLFWFGSHKTSQTGQQKSRVLARNANSRGPIKYRIKNTRFLSKHDVNVKRYWDNIVPITACLLGNGLPKLINVIFAGIMDAE